MSAWGQVGSLKGPQGQQGIPGPPGNDGTSVVILGTVATSAALPASAPAVGDGYIAVDTGHLWVWGGASFSDVGQIKGDKGDTGPAGQNGTPGTPGTNGTNGAQGVPGTPGTNGINGSTGTRGSLWFTGSGAPGTIAGALVSDLYLDSVSGIFYQYS